MKKLIQKPDKGNHFKQNWTQGVRDALYKEARPPDSAQMLFRKGLGKVSPKHLFTKHDGLETKKAAPSGLSFFRSLKTGKGPKRT